MKKGKYKKNLFSNKLENSTNSKNILVSCSIIYEEIFNTTINNTQVAIRDNIQPLEDIFSSNNKNNNIITLEINLINNYCKIIRAGKGLYSFVNKNLFDLFPYFLKQYQIKIFIRTLFNGFNNEKKKQDDIDTNNSKGINNKNKNKKEFVEIKVLLYEKPKNKIIYKLLTLKLTPLFNNNIDYLILFNGTYTFSKNVIITVTDLRHKSEIDEKVLDMVDPEFESEIEHNNLISSLSLKKYISFESTKKYKLNKLYSYKVSIKMYNIYLLELKNGGFVKKREVMKKDDIKANDENGSEIVENTIKVYEENNSVNSSLQTSSFSKNYNSLGLRKTKKGDINHTGFNRIQKIIYGSIFVVIIIIIIEYLYFDKLKTETDNNNSSYINYRSFYRLYYQLFASVLGISCIPEAPGSGEKCRNLISVINNNHAREYPNISFNFSEYLFIQNEVIASKIIEEKAHLMDINKYIGEKRYNELFSQKIKYIQMEKKIEDLKIVYYSKETSLDFFNAILIICNSFSILTEKRNFSLLQPIYFLNKTENPFVHLKNQNEMSSYQEEVYKMILNYKYYSKQFTATDRKLFQVLEDNASFIKIIIFLFLNLNTILYLGIVILIYLFLICFKTIIIRVLNYIIMIINKKSDDFDFKSIFTQKIDNLFIILELYGSSPLEAIQNLNKIYNNYNQYLTNKKTVNNSQKALNKKYSQENENEMNDIPKNHQIITMKDVNKLNIHNKYQTIIIILIVTILITYASFIILWLNYFSQRTYLFNIIKKSAKLEESCYEAVNIYELMVFNNYTLDEMIDYLELPSVNNDGKIYDSNLIINSFYQNLFLVFDFEKDSRKIGSLYQDFEDLAEFNCDNLYVKFQFEILEKVDELISDLNLKQKLIDICEISHITDSRNVKTIYERHFQYIKNGMLSLTDFSYEGLNKNIDNGLIGSILIFFATTTIYVIEVTTNTPHKDSIRKIMYILGSRIVITEIMFLVFGLALILLIIFFYIYNINKFCNQIFLLKKTFNIFEMQEQ